jgi:DNA mismatch repair protein MutS
VPPDYHRKQTIAGGERFITPALKEYEEKVLGADERIVEREIEIFDALRGRVAAESPRVQDTARGLAALDVLAALAETASIQNYTKPLVHAGDELVATDVRHPVVERHVADAFVPNDVSLDAAAQQLVILTGPNMGGKSTYLRQSALLCLMAQAGRSCRRARRSCRSSIASSRASARRTTSPGPVDVHGRDAGDGEHPAHARRRAASSILDEIGRGTSTFDGLSLAWAVAEHLASNRERGRRPSSRRTITS